MKKLNGIISLCCSLSLLSCGSEPSQKIVGTYVRESMREERNINTGKVIGSSIQRDTIIITKKTEDYQLKNVVWKKNDYDNNGWQKQYQRAIKTHIVKYDKVDNSLNTEMSLYNPMYLDMKKGLLYYNENDENKWVKINNKQ